MSKNNITIGSQEDPSSIAIWDGVNDTESSDTWEYFYSMLGTAGNFLLQNLMNFFGMLQSFVKSTKDTIEENPVTSLAVVATTTAAVVLTIMYNRERYKHATKPSVPTLNLANLNVPTGSETNNTSPRDPSPHGIESDSGESDNENENKRKNRKIRT